VVLGVIKRLWGVGVSEWRECGLGETKVGVSLLLDEAGTKLLECRLENRFESNVWQVQMNEIWFFVSINHGFVDNHRALFVNIRLIWLLLA
jgi:hypothetical protein